MTLVSPFLSLRFLGPILFAIMLAMGLSKSSPSLFLIRLRFTFLDLVALFKPHGCLSIRCGFCGCFCRSVRSSSLSFNNLSRFFLLLPYSSSAACCISMFRSSAVTRRFPQFQGSIPLPFACPILSSGVGSVSDCPSTALFSSSKPHWIRSLSSSVRLRSASCTAWDNSSPVVRCSLANDSTSELILFFPCLDILDFFLGDDFRPLDFFDFRSCCFLLRTSVQGPSSSLSGDVKRPGNCIFRTNGSAYSSESISPVIPFGSPGGLAVPPSHSERSGIGGTPVAAMLPGREMVTKTH